MIDNSEQFIKNSGVLNQKDLHKLNSIKILVVGLGGLGGHIANGLVRSGVTDLILVDFDKFQLSNLNRQMFSNHKNIGQYKAKVVESELLSINPEAKISIFSNKVQELETSFDNVDMIIDCVDNIETKLYLEQLSITYNVPLLHGACGGWYGQVSLIKSDKSILNKLYKDNLEGLEKELLNPYFAPSVVASYMLSEFIKWIKDSKYTYNRLLLIDVYNNILESINLCGDSNG